MRNAIRYAIIFFLSWSSISSCKDDVLEAPVRWPPEPIVQYKQIIVGSGIDTLPLASAGKVLPPDINIYFASDWQSRWACIEKPTGTADPRILGASSMSAMAVGLSVGDYTFEVTYTTQAGSKKNIMQVKVVPDKPVGTVVLLDDLTWIVSTIGPLGETVPPYAFTWLTNSPDLFFYRGLRKEPVVEYLDPKSNQWTRSSIHPDLTNDISFGLLSFNESDQVYFNYTQGNMGIMLGKYITPDWLPAAGKHPAVRLIY